jgi:hypothetical protein
MRGKSHAHQRLWVSQALIRDLSWFTARFAATRGISFFTAIAWKPCDADLVIYTDASSIALGFYALSRNEGFFLNLADLPFSHSIFFNEALALCNALHWASTLLPLPTHLAIFTDSSNTVSIFNSYRADTPYNTLLQWAVDLLMLTDIDLWVFHVCGRDNTVADALSRLSLTFLCASYPALTLSTYALPPSLRRALSQ